jgi:haloacetate dehalogenase
MSNEEHTWERCSVDRRDVLKTSVAALSTLAGATAASAQASLSRASTLRFFPGFEAIRIDTSEATINGVKGGSGPPLLLLHGFPQTHVEWRSIAPKLSRHFTVVATDLRGYGDSSKPADGRNHEGYSKRSVARDQVEVMRQLGFERFYVIGHDRGGRVAHRMTLDFPKAVLKMVLLDIVPTYKLFNPVTKGLATAYFHFFLFLQPAPFPETLIANSLEYYLRGGPENASPAAGIFRGLIPNIISEDAYSEYLRCMKDPPTLHAMIEDYRAAASIDLEHDQIDLDKKIECPLLVLWDGKGAMEPLYDVLATWRERAIDVRGRAFPGGHWIPEQFPNELYDEVLRFFS